MKNLSPARQEEYESRLEHVLDKGMPESYRYRCLYDLYLDSYKCFAKAQFVFGEAFFPFANPEKHTSGMKKMASEMLLMTAALGEVKRGQKIIHELKADVNYQDTNGNTPLSYAIRRKRLGMAEMLLQNGADAQKANREYLSPVLKACADDFIKAIPVFAKYGVDFNKGIRVRLWNRFYLGWKNYTIYPLIYAVVRNKVALCAELLKYGAHLDVDFKGITLRSALLRDKAEKHGSFSQEIHAMFQPYLVASKNKISERIEKQKTRE